MRNRLKEKVGYGGLDPKVLEQAQKKLDLKVEQQGADWLKANVENLSRAYEALEDKADITDQDLKELICAAVDLRSTALFADDQFLSNAARSLHTFAELADPANDNVLKLIAVHIQAILSLQKLDQSDSEANRVAKVIVSELKTAASKLAAG